MRLSIKLWSATLLGCAIISAEVAAAESRKTIDRLMKIEREEGLAEVPTSVFLMGWQVSLLAEKLRSPEAVAAAAAIVSEEARAWRSAIEPLIEEEVRKGLTASFDDKVLQAIADYHERDDVAAHREALRRFRNAPGLMTEGEIEQTFDRAPEPAFIDEYRSIVGRAAMAALKRPEFCDQEGAFRNRLRQRLDMSMFYKVAPNKSCAEIVASAR